MELTVARSGEPKPLILRGAFRAATPAGTSEGLAKSSALQITGSFPIPFLLVAFAVLFLRLEEPNAWLLALLFCAFAAAPSFLNPLAVSPALRAFAFAFRAVFAGMLGPLFYLFFAVFPLQSPLDRRRAESERETSRIMRETGEHSEDEYKFYVRHGHWPEQACGPECAPQIQKVESRLTSTGQCIIKERPASDKFAQIL